MQRWEKGSQAMVSVNAIFAGFSGALVAVLVACTDSKRPCYIQFSIGLAVASLILFAAAAEKITDALDEGKVTTYLCSMFIYDIAVVLLLLSIAIFLVFRSYYWPGVIPILGMVYPWLTHICWFFFAGKKRKQEYIEELRKES